MGWNDLDKSSGQKAPLLNARDCTTPTRIRLISGPARYSEPEQIWQHWAPEGAGMPPIMCIGERNGCIFHEEPIAWRLGKTNVMNCIHYTANATGGFDAKIVVLQAPATLLTQIRDQSRNVSTDPTTVDWIISKSGQGKEGTKYNAVLAPGLPLHGATIDLSQWPAQDAEFAHPNIPQLVDYDKIEGFQPMTSAEQEAWFDKVADNVRKKREAKAGDGAAPAAPPAGGVAPVAPPPAPAAAPPAAPAASAPPAPAPAAPAPAAAPLPTMPAAPPPAAPAAPPAAPPPAPAAPPPAPAPAAPNPLDAAKALPDPWNQGRTMGALAPHELQFIVDNAGSFAAFPSQLQAAKMILEGGASAPAAPAAAAPPASGDQAALKTQMEQLMQSMPIFQDFATAKSFFEKVTGKKTLKGMTADELGKLVSIAQQGDGAVRQAIAG